MMIDPVHWTRMFREQREREALRHQQAARARAVLREPAAPLRRDAVRTLAFSTKRRHAAAVQCCMQGAGA
jgi:hypothetical protein